MEKRSTLLIAALTITVMISSLTPLMVGSDTDWTDATGIDATYATSDSGTTGSTQSIQKAGITAYITWNGVWNDPQAFAFAQAYFNTMEVGAYQWEYLPVRAIQDFKDAGMAPLGYQRFAQVEYSTTPEYCSADWVECNAHEDWFIHDAVTGGRIWNPSDSGFLMDIGNAGFRQHWITYITNNLNIYQGFTGIFIDNTIGSLNPNWIPWVRFTDRSQPVFKTSDLNNWHANAVNFLAQIKAAFPDKTLIINTDGFNYDYVDKVDGVMIEGFTHAAHQNAEQHNSADSIESQIDYFGNVSSNGKIAWYCSGTSTGTTAQIDNLVKYCLSGALISNNNPQSMFSFNDWLSFDGSHGYYPIMDTQIGSPTGAYYKSQNVYIRDFTDGKVLFNPSDNFENVDLSGEFWFLNNTKVSDVTLEGYSGEILLNKLSPVPTEAPSPNPSTVVPESPTSTPIASPSQTPTTSSTPPPSPLPTPTPTSITTPTTEPTPTQPPASTQPSDPTMAPAVTSTPNPTTVQTTNSSNPATPASTAPPLSTQESENAPKTNEEQLLTRVLGYGAIPFSILAIAVVIMLAIRRSVQPKKTGEEPEVTVVQ